MNEFERTDALNLLKTLVAIPSVNPACCPDHPELTGERRMVDFLKGWADRHQIPYQEYLPAEGRPVLVLTLDPAQAPASGGSIPTLACFVHLDTVWTPAMEAPFELRQNPETGLWHGLGASDDKGPLTACLLALLKIRAEHRSQCRFQLACSCDEEVGFRGIDFLVPEILRPDAALVSEGTDLDLAIAHKGNVIWEIATHGKAIHSSMLPGGENAIYHAAEMILKLRELAGELEKRPPHPLLGHPTLNVGVIRGGTQPNAVPDFCSFRLDRRMLPGETADAVRREAEERIRSVTSHYTSMPPLLMTMPYELSPEHPWAVQAKRVLLRHCPRAKTKALHCATEAARTHLNGIPTIVFGPGSISVAHTAGESIDAAQIGIAAGVIADLVNSFEPF